MTCYLQIKKDLVECAFINNLTEFIAKIEANHETDVKNSPSFEPT